MKRYIFVMIVIASAFAAQSLAASARQAQKVSRLGIGRAATPDEIKKIDIDVRPDGAGLPEGTGTPSEGAKVYAAKCQSCHGANGQGGSADRLVDRESGKNWDFATNAKLVKTVGNYWPYSTTLYDYIVRAMPQDKPGSLTANETYAVIAWILNRTPLGLAVRMVGENPAAAEGQGLDVVAVRIGAIVAGSALMGVGGAFLTLSAFNSFYFQMVNGRGWICVALVVFAGWRPGKALVGALLFAFFDAMQLRLQQADAGAVPYQAWLMLPYVLSIVALIAVARRASYPQALMKPYRKGER